MPTVPTTYIEFESGRVPAHTILCHEGTRTSILQEGMDWAMNTDPKTPPILWLNGRAGIGKSTIARTLMAKYRAAGLCCGEYSVTPGYLEDKRDSAITDLFEHFIVQPLLKLQSSPPEACSVIILLDDMDGLCRRNTNMADLNVHHILPLFIDNLHRLPFVRILVTSRPGRIVHRIMQKHQDHILELNVDRYSASRDIRIYLWKHLFDVCLEEAVMSGSSGSVLYATAEDLLQKLVVKSNKLFIYAHAIVHFIRSRTSVPRHRLRGVVDDDADLSAAFKDLDKMYRSIVQDALADWRCQGNSAQSFHEILGSVIYNPSPISVKKLIQLFNSRYTASQIRSALQCLDNVIAVPDSDDQDGIVALHQSFVDFIGNEIRCQHDIRLHHAIHRPAAFKRYMCALMEKYPGATVMEDREWDFSTLTPTLMAELIDEAEQHLFQGSPNPKRFLSSVVDRFSKPISALSSTSAPKWSSGLPSNVPRHIDFVYLNSSPPKVMKCNLLESRVPMIVGGGAHPSITPGFSGAINPLYGHAEVFVDSEGKFFIKDIVGTYHGTFINDGKLKKGKFYPLQPGDIVQFGFQPELTHRMQDPAFRRAPFKVDLSGEYTTVS